MDLKAELLGFADLRTKQVTVPVWKRKVTIRELGLLESMEWAGPDKVDADGKIRLTGEDIARVVAYGVVDDDGKRVFDDKDVPALARKNRKALMFLYNEITGLSGSFEDAEKN